MINIVYKSLVIYVFIIFIYKILNKNIFKTFNIIDISFLILIIGIVISNLSSELSVVYAIIPISILVIFQIFINHKTSKNIKFKKLVSKEPTVIINNGKINFKELNNSKYNLDSLIKELKENGIKRVDEVECAILESNGSLSILSDSYYYPITVILNGEIDYEIINKIKKNEVWLKEIILNNKLKLSDIFYAFYTGDKLFIITKKDLLT